MSENPIAQFVDGVNIPKHVLSFLKTLTGPAIVEMSELLGDQVRQWRFNNQINVLTKAQQKIEKKGISPKQIDLKMLVPLLGYCSLETDESLQDMWANLLANASSSNNQFESYSIYVDILWSLSTNEALLLLWMFDQVRIEYSLEKSLFNKTEISEFINLKEVDIEILLDNLCRLRLIEIQMQNTKGGFFSGRFNKKSEYICMSRLGYEMIKNCK